MTIPEDFKTRLEIAKKKIGENIEILYETKDLSYTNNFYKVTVDSKNKKIDKMNGQIINVRLKSFSNGKFFDKNFLNHQVSYDYGMYAEESKKLLQDFFQQKR